MGAVSACAAPPGGGWSPYMRRTTLGVSVLLVILASVLLFAQSATFAVLSYGPTGEINQLQDANEIRVIFSEPMVALGRIPSNPTPPWLHISPAINGAFRWSGTTILIFTPDPTTPLPYATRYTVTVDAVGHERQRPPARRRPTTSRSRRRPSG